MNLMSTIAVNQITQSSAHRRATALMNQVVPDSNLFGVRKNELAEKNETASKSDVSDTNAQLFAAQGAQSNQSGKVSQQPQRSYTDNPNCFLPISR